MLQLGSAAFATLSAGASQACQQLGIASGSPDVRRSDQRRITGNVAAVLFDFDGTLTATPGDRAQRKLKIAELKERAPMLKPWLQRLRDANISLGIISKSSEDTILSALRAAKIRDLFDGPVLAKAVGLEGKAGFIEDLCMQGGLSFLGQEGMCRVLLVDDDVHELVRCQERKIQTYPAPQTGGLLDDDFYQIFEGLGLEQPPRPPESLEIHRLWSNGLAGETMGMDPEPTQVDYTPGSAPLLSEHYQVLEDVHALGQGSFGICRPSLHLASGRRCAMKFIRKDLAGRHYLDTFVEQDMFTFLLRMSRREPHPNVVRQLDYLMGPKVIYNAMELLEGRDLFTWLQENAPITEGLARRILRQTLAALRHIHSVSGIGLIHRDVKLENLRFRSTDPRSDLVLVDFGLSCAATPDQRRGIFGTLLYMAPEIFSNYYTTQVDLWSTGVLFYIILTGKPPWSQDPSRGLTPNRAVTEGNALSEALAVDEIAAAPKLAVELLRGLLVVAPGIRLSAEAAIEHEWLRETKTAEDISDWHSGNVIDIRYQTACEAAVISPKARLGVMVRLEEGGTESSQKTASSSEQAEMAEQNRAPVPHRCCGWLPWPSAGDNFKAFKEDGKDAGINTKWVQ